MIEFSGSVMTPICLTEPFDLSWSDETLSSIVLIGRPVLGLATSELVLDRQTFVSCHSMDLRFVSCDNTYVS